MSRETAFRDSLVARGGRKLRRWCWTVLVLALILAAVIVGIGRLVAPYADHARPWLEQHLGDRLAQPVRIEEIRARWPRLSPQIDIRGIRIGPVEVPDLEIDRARLDVQLQHLLRPARNTLQLVVLGLDLAVEQDEDGYWTWQLEGGARVAADWQRNLVAGDMLIRDARIRLAGHGFREVRLRISEAEFHRDGSEIRARVQAVPEGTGQRPVEARLSAILNEQKLHSASAWIRAEDLDPLVLLAVQPEEPIVERGPWELEMWADWSREEGVRVYADLKVHDPDTDGTVRLTSEFEAHGRWRPGNWEMEISGREIGRAADDKAHAMRRLAVGRREGRLAVGADRVDLGLVHRLAGPWLAEFPGFPTAVEGRVHDLGLGLNSDFSPYHVSGYIEGLAVELPRPGIGMEALNLDLGLDGDQVVLDLEGAPTIEWPDMLRTPAAFDEVTGRVRLNPGMIGFDRIELRHGVLDARLDGTIVLDKAGPFLDISVVAERLEPGDPRPWLPHGLIPAPVLAWLDQSVSRLDSGQADLVFHGRPRNWPELINPGSFAGVLDFAGMNLDYWPQWPGGRNLEGRVVFAGREMRGRVDGGEVEGVSIRAAEAFFADLLDAVLVLDLETPDADAAGLARLARAFPVDRLADALVPLDWSGPARATARLELRLAEVQDWRLQGTVELEDVDFRLHGPDYWVQNIHGRARYDREGFQAQGLSGRLGDQPVELDIEGRFQPAFEMSISGELPSAGLVPPAWQPGLLDPQAGLDGASVWLMRLVREEEVMVLRLESDLAGTELKLPAPLDKSAADELPFALRWPLGAPDEALEASLGRRLAVRALTDPHNWRLAVVFGRDLAGLPAEGQFAVTGRIDRLDLGGWTRLLPQFGLDGASGAAGASGYLDLEIGTVTVAGLDLEGLALRGLREPDEWLLEAESPWLAGSLLLQGGSGPQALATVELEQLHWPRAEREDAPLPEPSPLDPRGMPGLDVTIEDLRFGDLELGRFVLEARPVEDGLEFTRFEAESRDLSLVSTGRWHAGQSRPGMIAEVTLRTGDLGGSLTAAGYDMALQGGTAHLELTGAWLGSPLDFALAGVDGRLGMRIDDGSIPEARPGAGRLLGLVSLGSIPRRLRLDFRDVFGPGLRFDRIAGEFRLADGKARTDALDIDAPAAQIRLSGTTDLRNRRYDQELRVQPGLGSTLPIIGALAGGPIGAAAGAALQQLLDRPLRGLSEVRYRITGGWDDPEIVLIGAEPAPADNDETGPDATGEPDGETSGNGL